jgi:hypothetical protein
LKGQTIEIAYEAGQGSLERYARSFQSVALLEALSDYASSRHSPIRYVAELVGADADSECAPSVG